MAPGEQISAQLLHDFPEIVLVLDASGNVRWANTMAERFFGRTLSETIGTSALEFVHPDDLELVLRSLETVQGKDVGNYIEIRVRRGDSWHLIELVGTPISWFEKGAVLFSLRDLTERRRFEVAHDDVARFRSLVHNAASIMLLISPTGTIDSASGALTRSLGHDPEEIEGTPLEELVVPADRPALRAALEVALEGATASSPVVVGVRLAHRDSERTSTFELAIVNLVDDPTVGSLAVTAHDVSARVAAELELRNTFSLLNATLDATADGILVVDNERRITSFNRQFCEMWRVPEALLAERDDVETLRFVTEQLVDAEGFLARVESLYAEPHASSEDTILFKDGRVFDRSSRPQFVGGEIVGRVWSFSDITEQKRLEEDLAHLAFHDPLTGLPNRALFKDRLDMAMAKAERSGAYVAVLFLDVDDFKTINDSMGHSVGDDLLREVARTLAGCLRRSDTAARLGGDEFAVLVEGFTSHDAVVTLARRIVAAMRRPMLVGRQNLSVTASVGVTFGLHGTTSDGLLSNADLAMYSAKNSGKDRFEVFEERMHKAVVARLDLEADLRRAIAHDDFVVHYQPILDLEDGRIVGFEALVRWPHPTRGLLLPAAFIPFAEEIGVIGDIAAIVLREACSAARRWHDRGGTAAALDIGVNLSAHEVMDPSIGEIVAETLRVTGFDPAHLVLEITESAVMRDVASAARNLRSLAALGLRVAIDDFGTGYSSFSHLQELPVSILKIDRSFLAMHGAAGGLTEVTRAIIQLALALGLVPIAEGVEREEQAVQLLEAGCRLAQGYHLGRPMHEAAAGELLVASAPRSHPA